MWKLENLTGPLPLLLLVSFAAAEVPVNERAKLLEEFDKRATAYADLHRKLSSELPKLPEKATPEQIQAHEKELTAKIRAARPDARQGDIFTSGVAAVLREMVQSEFREPDGARVKEAVRQDNPEPALQDPKMRTRPQRSPPPSEVVLAPNTPYPSGAPVSTVPPEIFTKLPKLPELLEYRFVGRHLVLRDRDANMIVDFMTDAMPQKVGPR